MRRRKLLAVTAGIGTTALAGCSGLMNDSPEENTSQPDSNDTNTDTGGNMTENETTSEDGNTTTEDNSTDETTPEDDLPSEEEINANVEERLLEFYNAWLDRDGGTMAELLHDPRSWGNDEELQDLRDVEFEVDVASVNAELVSDSVDEETLVDWAENDPSITVEEARTIAETPTRSYRVEPELTGEPTIDNDAEQEAVDNVTLPGHRMVSQQDGSWKIV